MIRTISDFTKNWAYESQSTLKVFEQIGDAEMNTKLHENVRSLAFLAWHLTITTGEMLGKAGLKINSPEEHSKAPGNMKAIVEAYKTAAESVASEVEKCWEDNDLETKVEMYGDTWEKGKVLEILITHQAHHRGQMTVIMRLLGLKVPGVYGPSKEEWVEYGMAPMD
ncbi:MAG: DinB family protein [Bacteroidia bacterium]